MFTIIVPCEEERLPLWERTSSRYEDMADYITEMIVVSRTIKDLPQRTYPTKLIIYEYPGDWVCPARALNMGVAAATTERVIITCPEIMPCSSVLKQFSMDSCEAIVARVFDTDKDGKRKATLVSSVFRAEHPGFYFLACYNKQRILEINGWDENFLDGAGYEDNDFGERWVRSGHRHEIRDDIVAEHLWHERNQVHREGPNIQHYKNNKERKIIRAAKGIKKGQ